MPTGTPGKFAGGVKGGKAKSRYDMATQTYRKVGPPPAPSAPSAPFAPSAPAAPTAEQPPKGFGKKSKKINTYQK